MGSPTLWLTSTIGRMSATVVRAAAFARMESPVLTISVASAVTVSTARGPAPGRPIFAE